MDYKIFARENYNPTTLRSVEISDPVSGLKEFLIGKSADQFKRHLGDLLFAVFEKHGWRQHGAPVNLYAKAREMAKLMDFVWLITTCEVGAKQRVVSPEGYYLTEQYRRRTFDRLFIKTPLKNKSQLISLPDMARAIFKERHGLLLKSNIEEVWLDVAFNASYMRNLTIDFHGIESSTDVHDYWCIITIIDAAFALANSPILKLDGEKLQYYQLFASDNDHPDWLFGEQIDLLFEGIGGVWCYIDEVKFPKAIHKWFSLISKTDHWERHNDPGNILFIKGTVQRMVETAWLQSRIGFPELSTQEINMKYVKDLSVAQIADPIAYIGYFFEQHRLHEWKSLLDTWLAQSLSDEQQPDTEVTGQDRNDIIKLIQVLRLIEHRM